MKVLIPSKLYMQKTFQEISKNWCETKRPIVKHSTTVSLQGNHRRIREGCIFHNNALNHNGLFAREAVKALRGILFVGVW